MTDKERSGQAEARITDLLVNGQRPRLDTVEACHERLLELRAVLVKSHARLLDSSATFYQLCQFLDGGQGPPVALVVGLKPARPDAPAECRLDLDLAGGGPVLRAILEQAGAVYAADWHSVRAVAEEADYLCAEVIPQLLQGEAAAAPS